MNIGSAEERSKQTNPNSAITKLGTVHGSILSSLMLLRDGKSSESGNDSIQRSWDGFLEMIETIDRYDYVPLTNYMTLQMENASPKGRIAQVEAVTDEQHSKMWRTNRSRKNWMQLDFDNDDSISKYTREEIHPYHPYPPPKWLKYI